MAVGKLPTFLLPSSVSSNLDLLLLPARLLFFFLYTWIPALPSVPEHGIFTSILASVLKHYDAVNTTFVH